MYRTLRSIVLTGALLVIHGPALAHSEGFWFGQPGDGSKVNRTIKVTALDIKFKPAKLTVRAGETVKFEITNTGKLEHEFVLADHAAQEAHEKEMQDMMQKMPGMSMERSDPNAVTVKAGETKNLIWTFTKAGKLQFGCHVPGHFAAGMVGQLTVK